MPPPNAAPGRAGTTARRALALVLLVALALALRLAPIRHGLPRTSYVPDTHVVRGALGMAKERTLVPPSGRYTSYPYLLPYLLLPVYGAEYALGRATGAWGGPGEFGMRLLEEPARAHLAARVLVALFGALTPLLVFGACRTLGLRAGAWAAAWLVATGLLHVHFSVQERPWVPMTAFVVLSAWAAAAHVARGAPRALLLAWVAAALAFATHQGGLFAAGIPGLAWLVGPRPGVGRSARALVLGTVAFLAVALLVGHPYLLVHGQAAPEHVSGGLGGDVQVGGQGFSYAFRLASLERMAGAFAAYDPATMLLGLAGLPLALRHRAAWPATAFALVFGAVFLTNFNDHVRYLLPFAVLLAPSAGLAAEGLWARGAAARAALLVLLAVPLAQASRLAVVLRRPDTRAIAEARLERDAPGARVALDVYGPDVPLDRASLERLAGWRALQAREEHRRLLLEAGQPTGDGPGIDALRVEDLFDFDGRRHGSSVKPALRDLLAEHGGDPNAILAALGVTHVLLVDRDPGDGVPPFLVDPTPPLEGAPKMPLLALDPEPLWVVDPSRAGTTAREARLPTELERPLTSLWQVTRPGPRLALHRLEGAR